jgi:hypothetical protein
MTPRMRVQKCNPQLATQLAICELYVDDTPRFFDTVGRAITVVAFFVQHIAKCIFGWVPAPRFTLA